jgi:hypothetical protein
MVLFAADHDDPDVTARVLGDDLDRLAIGERQTEIGSAPVTQVTTIHELQQRSRLSSWPRRLPCLCMVPSRARKVQGRDDTSSAERLFRGTPARDATRQRDDVVEV